MPVTVVQLCPGHLIRRIPLYITVSVVPFNINLQIPWFLKYYSFFPHTALISYGRQVPSHWSHRLLPLTGFIGRQKSNLSPPVWNTVVLTGFSVARLSCHLLLSIKRTVSECLEGHLKQLSVMKIS